MLLSFDRIKLQNLLENLKKSYSPEIVINELIVPALMHIGALWESGDLALSQIYMSSRLCENLITNLFPVKTTDQKKTPIIGLTILEDNHALGIQIIEYLLKAAGYNYIFYNLGIDVDTILERIITDNIEILLISTLMYRSALRIRDLSSRLRERNINVKLIVGGAPFNFDSELWKRVGADAVSGNVFEVLDLIGKFKGGVN